MFSLDWCFAGENWCFAGQNWCFAGENWCFTGENNSLQCRILPIAGTNKLSITPDLNKKCESRFKADILSDCSCIKS